MYRSMHKSKHRANFARSSRKGRSNPVRAAVVEALENRQLLAGDLNLVNALPFVLNFEKARKGLVDQSGQGTGFSYVQENKNGNEYQPQNLQLVTGKPGVLKVRTTGTSVVGTNFGTENSLTNAIGTQFNATGETFSVSTVLAGPLGYLDQPFEQAGIYFGPDQDNFVKLVAGFGNNGQHIQFLAETGSGTNLSYPLGTAGVNVTVPSFSTISTLSLTLVGSAATGKVQAFYQVNNGATQKIATELTLSGAQRTAFFGSKARAGILAQHRNNSGGITATFDRFAITADAAPVTNPSITAVRPGPGETGVSRDAFIAADVNLPTAGSGVDSATISVDSVRLVRVSDGAVIPANVNTSGGGDSVVLQPLDALDANTEYRFVVTAGLKDTAGSSFVPFQSTFRTGTAINSADPNIAFEKIRLPSAEGRLFSGVTIGPDGRLYATTLTGEIARWDINPATGELGDIQVIDTITQNMGSRRFVTGLAFDPKSTKDRLIAWVTHTQYAFEGASDFTGRLTMLRGANLESYRDMVTNLPRSVRDHVTNQPVFGPDGFLYVGQAANTAMGRADPTWGNRSEHLLTGTVLRIKTNMLVDRRNSGLGPLNVRTPDAGGTYNPFKKTNPVRVFANGVRNAYDLVFHSNGRLYAPTNGSAAGGNTPAGNGAPALTKVPQTQSDFLFDLVEGGYYGHPNPGQGYFVLNGGNPTANGDPFEVGAYPVGTRPDAGWRPAVFDFGKSVSPNGAIEYRSNSFKGRLQGKLLVTRYSGGDDLIALSFDRDGKVSKVETGITGLTHFIDPLDVTEDPRNGSLYVVEFGAERITLARPITGGPNLTVDSSRLLFNDIRGDGKASTRVLNITNTGSAPLTISALTIKGAGASLFSVTNAPRLPATVEVGKSIQVTVGFNAPVDAPTNPRAAVLSISSDDRDQPGINVRLRGMPTAGEGGNKEPSLQRVLDLYEIPINVGDPDPGDTFLNPPNSQSEEVTVQRLVKASSGSVIIEPLAMFGVATNPALRFGFYESGTGENRTELFTINGKDAQSVNPFAQGSTTFDPGSAPFSLFGLFPQFRNADGSSRVVYSEDSLNTWESIAGNRRKVRFYPLKNPNGAPVPNAYVFAFEEFTRDYDQQDFVGIIRNVKVAPAGPELGIENLDGSPFFDRLVFNFILNQDSTFGNVFKDTAKLRIRNTGNQPLSLTGLSTSGPFQIVSGGGGGSIAAGGFRDVTVRFTATGGDILNGTLTITSNDPDEPIRRVKLSGFWQSHSESDPLGRSQEPTAQEIISTFGYTTVAVGAGQKIDTLGNIVAVGDEVLSSFWRRADGSQPVRVRQLAAFHMQGNTATFSWFAKGSPNSTKVFSHEPLDGQSFLPRLQNNNAAPAAGGFSPSVSQPFGIRVDNIWSEQSRNNVSVGGEGHYMRFYPVRDQDGNYIENTWIMVMDYERLLADYNDNVYLIENMYPDGTPTPPDGLTGLRTGGRAVLDWADNPEKNIAGYNVYRSLSPTGQFSKRNAVTITESTFSESVNFTAGTRIYYRVTALTADGKESVPSSFIVTM